MRDDLTSQFNYQRLSFGDFGIVILAGTDSTEEFVGIVKALEDSVISFTNDNLEQRGDLTVTDLQLMAGDSIYAPIKDLTLSSGKILAYLRSNQ